MKARMSLNRARTIVIVSLLLVVTDVRAQKQHSPRIEVGPELNQIYLPVNPVGSVSYPIALGGIFSFNVNHFVGVDSSLTVTPNSPGVKTDFAGGRLTQFSAGVRVGMAKRRFAMYGKLRPGIASFGSVVKLVDLVSGQFIFGRLTEPSLDVGGIIETSLTRRFALRYEAGDTLIHYRTRPVFTGAPAPLSRGQVTSNFQFGVGFMFRFH
jgi:hypothetical protein